MSNELKLVAIRGAICAENTKDSISNATVEMCNKLFSENNLKTENVVSMQFTLTKDLDEMNPCAALRFSGWLRKTALWLPVSKIPLFCSQEAYIKNGLPKVIRVLITTYVEKNQDITHVYINGAEKLRPDFCKK